MFLIASTGRCGTVALCSALGDHSDHEMAHEVPPRLLEEAWLKHRGESFRTPDYESKLALFRAKEHTAYGEAFRGCTLLPEIAEAAPGTRFLIVVRDPLGYIPSAHYMWVLRKPGTTWDGQRILPADDTPHRPLALRLADHWDEVNRYLLDFAESTSASVKVVLHGPLDERVDDWADFAGVRFIDRAAVSARLDQQLNSSTTFELPDGFDPVTIRARTRLQWERAQRLAAQYA